MKLELNQNNNINDPEIEIRYSILTDQLKHIIHAIHQSDLTIEVFIDEHIYHLPIIDILYFEVTDRKTFSYTKDKVYECRKNILSLEKKLMHTSFVRISKGSLLNTTALLSVKPYPNHRILAKLNNGENLIVSRKYIPVLKEKLRSS